MYEGAKAPAREHWTTFSSSSSSSSSSDSRTTSSTPATHNLICCFQHPLVNGVVDRMSTRSRVLSLYRTILRTGRHWQGPQEASELCLPTEPVLLLLLLL
jgi:hypothetical protein